jgi:hypothetical protein
MKFCFWNSRVDCLELLPTRTGCEHITAALCHSCENLRNLLRSLASRVDHLGQADAQRTMVIDLGKSDIFEWKVAQAMNRLVRRKLRIADLFQQRS